MRPRRIVLHCSDTEDGPTLSWPAIRRYHVEERGWSDVGYHFGLERYSDDRIHAGTVLLPGRPWHLTGAHVAGHNTDSLGLCIVGRFDDEPPDCDLKRETFDALALLAFAFGITAAAVYFHRDFNSGKTCPGKLWNREEVRDGVDRRLRDGWPVVGRHLRLDLVKLP